jgi:hypothetical protein
MEITAKGDRMYEGMTLTQLEAARYETDQRAVRFGVGSPEYHACYNAATRFAMEIVARKTIPDTFARAQMEREAELERLLDETDCYRDDDLDAELEAAEWR